MSVLEYEAECTNCGKLVYRTAPGTVYGDQPKKLSKVVAKNLRCDEPACRAPMTFVRWMKPEGDAECTHCGKMFWSAEGHPDMPLCRSCWKPETSARL